MFLAVIDVISGLGILSNLIVSYNNLSDFVTSEENVTIADYGETAEIICPLSQDIAKTYWTGPPDETIYNFPNPLDIIQTVPNADRLEINATNAGLLIHNVTLQDQGIYKCTAILNVTETMELWLEVTNGKKDSAVSLENMQKSIVEEAGQNVHTL